MDIPFFSFAPSHESLREEMLATMQRVYDSNWYILGKEVEAFEEEYAEYCGTEYCIGVASGLDALIIALRCLGVGEGDEVIVPSNTYIATWLAVTRCGAWPKPVEPGPQGCNLDPSQIEKQNAKFWEMSSAMEQCTKPKSPGLTQCGLLSGIVVMGLNGGSYIAICSQVSSWFFVLHGLEFEVSRVFLEAPYLGCSQEII